MYRLMSLLEVIAKDGQMKHTATFNKSLGFFEFEHCWKQNVHNSNKNVYIMVKLFFGHFSAEMLDIISLNFNYQN